MPVTQGTRCSLAGALFASVLVAQAILPPEAPPDPSRQLWSNIKAQLTGAGSDRYFQSNLRDALLPPLRGTLVHAVMDKGESALLLALSDSSEPDALLLLQNGAVQLKSAPQPGTQIEFSGIVTDFNKEPFLLTFKVEITRIRGLDFESTPPALQNADFSQNQPGQRPAHWTFASATRDRFVTQTEAAGACMSGHQCASLRSIGPAAPAFFGQAVDTWAFAAKTFRLRANIRADFPTDESTARLVIRFHEQGRTGFTQDASGRRTSRAWTPTEVAGNLPSYASFVEVGVELVGGGTVFLDDVSLEFSK